MLAEMCRLRDKLSTCFHHSLDLTGAFASVLLFLLINSLIFLLTSASRYLLLGAILDFTLINDFTKGVIHIGSRDDMHTDGNGILSSMWCLIFASKLFTASSTTFKFKTLSQFSLTSFRYNSSLRCLLQSLMRTFCLIGFNFVPAGKMTPVWSVFMDTKYGMLFAKIRPVCEDLV